MVSGLAQLSIYGVQDLLLTGKPQITFFKTVYRKATQFAIESIPQYFFNTTDFGSESSCVIEHLGDLMYQTYLEIELPPVTLNPQAQTQVQTETWRRLKLAYINYNVSLVRQVVRMIQPIGVVPAEVVAWVMQPEHTHRLRGFYDEIIPLSKADVMTTRSILNQVNVQLVVAGLASNTDVASALVSAFENGVYYQALKRCMALEFKGGEQLENETFAWSWELANVILQQIDVAIGNQVMDTHTGDWYIITNGLMIPESQRGNYNILTGNVDVLTAVNAEPKPSYTLVIPLQFWFCRCAGLALPLIALKYQDITFSVKFRDLAEVCHLSAASLLEKQQILTEMDLHLEAKIWVDYVFLAREERTRFAEYSHEYLIEALQIEIFENILQPDYVAHLEFVNPIKYMVWTTQTEAQAHGWQTQYLYDASSPLDATGILVNNYPLTNPDLPVGFFSDVQPVRHFLSAVSANVYVYSFALAPMEWQPTGTINASRLDDLAVRLRIRTDWYQNYAMTDIYSEYPGFRHTVYAVSYNILRIMAGMASLAFK